jgi:hypothetical protein
MTSHRVDMSVCVARWSSGRDIRRLPPFTMGSVCHTSLSLFDISIVTVVGLLGILGLRREGPESFYPSDICSES